MNGSLISSYPKTASLSLNVALTLPQKSPIASWIPSILSYRACHEYASENVVYNVPQKSRSHYSLVGTWSGPILNGIPSGMGSAKIPSRVLVAQLGMPSPQNFSDKS